MIFTSSNFDDMRPESCNFYVQINLKIVTLHNEVCTFY